VRLPDEQPGRVTASDATVHIEAVCVRLDRAIFRAQGQGSCHEDAESENAAAQLLLMLLCSSNLELQRSEVACDDVPQSRR